MSENTDEPPKWSIILNEKFGEEFLNYPRDQQEGSRPVRRREPRGHGARFEADARQEAVHLHQLQDRKKY